MDTVETEIAERAHFGALAEQERLRAEHSRRHG